jgi:hypothetical protein
MRVAAGSSQRRNLTTTEESRSRRFAIRKTKAYTPTQNNKERKEEEKGKESSRVLSSVHLGEQLIQDILN